MWTSKSAIAYNGSKEWQLDKTQTMDMIYKKYI